MCRVYVTSRGPAYVPSVCDVTEASMFAESVCDVTEASMCAESVCDVTEASVCAESVCYVSSGQHLLFSPLVKSELTWLRSVEFKLETRTKPSLWQTCPLNKLGKTNPNVSEHFPSCRSNRT